MSNEDNSFQEMSNFIQKLASTLKTIGTCSGSAKEIVLLKEKVAKLAESAEKIYFNNPEFQEYIMQLNVCVEILTNLEEPSKALASKATEVKNVFASITAERNITLSNATKLKSLLGQTLCIAKDVGPEVSNFVSEMEQARKLCAEALKSAEAAEKKMQSDASDTFDSGEAKGSVSAGLGLAALALGIAGIATGGAAYVVAGAVGVAVGGTATLAGTAIAVDAVLSAQELSKKADKFQKTVNEIQLCLKSAEMLEIDANKAIIPLTEENIGNLEIALLLFSQFNSEKQMKTENAKQEMEAENVKLRMEAENAKLRMEAENAKLRMEVEKLKLQLGMEQLRRQLQEQQKAVTKDK